jgi:hypothetical protein
MEPKLREEIDALYHKNVTTGQLKVHEQLEQVTQGLVEKGNELLERDGPDRRAGIEDAANLVLAIVHARLRRDLESFIEYQKIERDLRNNALTIVIRSHEEARSRCGA